MSLRPSLRLPRALDGLPIAGPMESRVSGAVAILASVWFALVAAWEMLGPVLNGHWASTGSMGIIAENMLRWRILGPVWEYTAQRPTPDLYYCHHPWGIFWVTAFLMKIVGRHDVVCRLAAILFSAATPPLLYALGRALWRPASGAAAAAGFAVLPITLAFANFNALEVPLIFWSLLALWGFVRYVQVWRHRYLLAGVVGLVFALHADWPAFVLAGELLSFWLLRGYLGGRRFWGPLHERRFAEMWIAAATISVLTGVLYLGLFQRIGKLGDLLAVYGSRSAGNAVPLTAVLESRKYWLELSFTPIAIILGKIGAVVCLVRVLATRAEVEIAPLVLLGMATFQYVVFKQGADIHVFWPQPFGAYFALAMGALVATIAPAAERLRNLLRRAKRRPAETTWSHAGLVALALALLPLVFVLRDGAPAAAYARATGGRFNEKGNYIESDGDKVAFLHDLAARLPMSAAIEMHESLHPNWALAWALGGRLIRFNRPVPTGPLLGKDDVFVLDSRFAAESELATAAHRFHVHAVGPFWAVFPREPQAPIDAASFEEREPTALEWMLVSATEPVRVVKPDPWLTWELRVHWEQPSAPPTEAPRTLEEKRIAHNAAVLDGDEAKAAALRAEIEGTLERIGASYDGNIDVVGSRFRRGVKPTLDLFFLCKGPLAAGSSIAVRARVLARARLSTTMADPTIREVGPPLLYPATRLRPGFLYVDAVPIVKRPGTELFQASLLVKGRVAKRLDAPQTAPFINVLRLD